MTDFDLTVRHGTIATERETLRADPVGSGSH
jgi:hypothetical protein